jgi:pyruvate-formate lyase-activating enzyme
MVVSPPGFLSAETIGFQGPSFNPRWCQNRGVSGQGAVNAGKDWEKGQDVCAGGEDGHPVTLSKLQVIDVAVEKQRRGR